jgi:hypothetical protein
MTKHEVFELVSLQPMKFTPLPAVIVTDEAGDEMLAVDRGYGFEAPGELSEESSKFLCALED